MKNKISARGGSAFGGKNKKAFSLLELVTVIGIIGIMTAVGIVSLTSLKAKMQLKTAKTEVISAIKLAQNYALQGKIQKASGVDERVCGYGLRFESGTDYEIFYNKLDTAADCGLQNATQQDHRTYGASFSVQAASGSFKLPQNVNITAATLGNAIIFFDVPNANTYDNNGADLAAGFIRITLSNSSGNTNIDVYNKGRIAGE